jgi:glycosyltransferase involved in cell wall biosynthesis
MSYLPRALDSACAQEGLGRRFDLEIIVVDDASLDGTPEVIRRYPRVRYLRFPERRGAAAAYNAGLRASRGEYISFLDDDDEWLSHKLRVQVPLLDAHPDVGVVYGQSLVRFGGKETLRPGIAEAPSGRVFLPMLLNNFCGHHACLLARREAFDRAGPFDESLASYEDYDMSLRLAFRTRFLFAPGAVDVYNLSPDGLWLTRAANGDGSDDAGRVIEKALRMLPDSAAYAAVKRAARARIALATACRIRDPVEAWGKALATLRAHPWIACAGWAQKDLVWMASRRALAAAAPLPAVVDLCAEIEAVSRGDGAETGPRVRQLLMSIQTDVARSVLPASGQEA